MQSQNIITTPAFATGFISSNEQTSSAALTVISIEHADITLNTNATIILIEGAIHYQVGPTKDIEAMFNMLLKINKEFLNLDTQDIKIAVNRHEMDYLRHFTECYLTHKENVKAKILANPDTEEAFDADMYITGKLLLLDIRQWQMGQVIYKEVIS